jgi:hypothetical protein
MPKRFVGQALRSFPVATSLCDAPGWKARSHRASVRTGHGLIARGIVFWSRIVDVSGRVRYAAAQRRVAEP